MPKNSQDTTGGPFRPRPGSLDRIAMLIAGESSIREVIAFPKNNKACDLRADSPTKVDFEQLRELYIQSTAKERN